MDYKTWAADLYERIFHSAEYQTRQQAKHKLFGTFIAPSGQAAPDQPCKKCGRLPDFGEVFMVYGYPICEPCFDNADIENLWGTSKPTA